MRTLSWLLSALILLAPAAQTFGAGQKADKQPPIEKIKIQVAKVGVGAKAKATITTKDGAKIKGYVSQAGDDDFVMRDRKTSAPTTIRYADVAKVERNQGHSIAKIVLISIGAGTAIVLVSVFLAIRRNG
jgi:uncharacterized protein YqfA (UPF0365 family)